MLVCSIVVVQTFALSPNSIHQAKYSLPRISFMTMCFVPQMTSTNLVLLICRTQLNRKMFYLFLYFVVCPLRWIDQLLSGCADS